MSSPPPTKRLRRKKVDQACLYCRRSHMTCDDSRPCTRCIRRKISHLCHDEYKKIKSIDFEPPPILPAKPNLSSATYSELDPEPTVKLEPYSVTHMFTGSVNPTSHLQTLSFDIKKLNPTFQPSIIRKRHDIPRSPETFHLTSNTSPVTNNSDISVHTTSSLTSPTNSSLSSPNSNCKSLSVSSFPLIATQNPEIKTECDTNYSISTTSTDIYSPYCKTIPIMTSNDDIDKDNREKMHKRIYDDWVGPQPAFSQTSENSHNLFPKHANSELSSLGEFLAIIESPDLFLEQQSDYKADYILSSDTSRPESYNSFSTTLSNQDGFSISQQSAQEKPVIEGSTNSTSFKNSLHIPNTAFNIQEHGNRITDLGQTIDGEFQEALHSSTTTDSNVPLNKDSDPAICNTNRSIESNHQPDPSSVHNAFFLTAADPAGRLSPEQRLKQVIRAKVDAGLLQPFNYARGYARLQKYMNNYMNQSSRNRIIKPLSKFRPAFLATARNLLDIDLALAEESFERMMLDYDRVFTSMAIPACLWRRTGEIYRGNKEFAGLVDASVEDLRDGKLAIYELMSEESAVNYWEKYGSIAFDPSKKAVLTSCNLRARDGRKKRVCSFSFTIQRDQYNVPSCIVGNFILVH